MLRSLSTDTITHTTNQPDKETTSKPTLLYKNKIAKGMGIVYNDIVDNFQSAYIKQVTAVKLFC